MSPCGIRKKLIVYTQKINDQNKMRARARVLRYGGFMQIKEISLSELVPYERNPRRNDKAVNAVKKSIEQFGFKVPIVIDADNQIVAGHVRFKAARILGFDKLPCIVASDLTPEQVKAFRLIDNKTAELAGWDYGKLGEELKSLAGELSSEFDFGIPSQNDLPENYYSTGKKEQTDFEQMTLVFSEEQKAVVDKALSEVTVGETFGNPNKNGNALYAIVKEWTERQRG